MDIVCFSHLRWDFVYQRPQHLMSRYARTRRVFYVEEPLDSPGSAFINTRQAAENILIVTPHIPASTTALQKNETVGELLKSLVFTFTIEKYIAWFYTPLMLEQITKLSPPELIVYDCMDELSAFKGADPSLPQKEINLLNVADIVFTGGRSLYNSKKSLHQAVYLFPSSIDKEHFSMARTKQPDKEDQAGIPHPRIGFFGVIDERLDVHLLQQVAALRPDWHLILIGPIVKIDPAILPRNENIHYLGMKEYKELPTYLAAWDVAMIPFAINESTRFISPTKTPEYLAGGKPVVTTPITDIVSDYGDKGLVYVATDPQEFIQGMEWALSQSANARWLRAVDMYLSDLSWDNTSEKMLFQINKMIESKINNTKNKKAYNV